MTSKGSARYRCLFLKQVAEDIEIQTRVSRGKRFLHRLSAQSCLALIFKSRRRVHASTPSICLAIDQREKVGGFIFSGFVCVCSCCVGLAATEGPVKVVPAVQGS